MSHSKEGSIVLKSLQGTIPKNSENKPRGSYFLKPLFEGLIFGGVYIRRGFTTEGNLRFKIVWASLIVGSKFIVFASFYFVFEVNFPSTSPQVAYIWRGDFHGGVFKLPVWGLIFVEAYGGAYFRNFTVTITINN